MKNSLKPLADPFMSPSVNKKSNEILLRLIVGVVLNILLVPVSMPDFNASYAQAILRQFICCSISAIAVVCLVRAFEGIWQSVAAALLMVIPTFLLTAGLVWLINRF